MIYSSKGMKPEPETAVYVDIKTPKMIEANMTNIRKDIILRRFNMKNKKIFSQMPICLD